MQGEDSPEQLIAIELWKLYKVKIPRKAVHIVEQQNKDQVAAVSYTLTHKKVPYAGILMSYRQNGKWYTLSTDMMKIYRDIRVQVADFGGTASRPDLHQQKTKFRTIYGYIHDPNIRQIRIEYQGGRTSTLSVAKGQTIYMDNVIEMQQQKTSFERLSRITMYSTTGQMIYEKDYSIAY